MTDSEILGYREAYEGKYNPPLGDPAKYMYEQGHRRAEAEMKEAAQAMESQDIGQIRRDYEEARRDGRQFIGNLEHIGALLIKVEQLIAVANLAQELVSRVREKEMLPESDAEIVGELEDAISRAI